MLQITGHVNIVKMLLKAGVDVNDVDEDGNTALTMAAWDVSQGAKSAAALLLSRRADVNAQDGDGNTALHYAVMNNNYGLCHLLIRYRADLNIENNEGKIPADYIQNENIANFFNTYMDRTMIVPMYND